MGLKEYHAKRDFQKTSEPKGKEKKHTRPQALTYVIQKHDASRLHYDFRLEMEGVLKSWAVPKGIPYAKGDKRLAMHVEDHPLDYGGFEGIIPEGNYGAGSVMLWDRGKFEPLGGDPVEDLNQGKLHFRLDGEKLKGEWTLLRMRGTQEKGDPWLLLKSGESIKPLSKKKEDFSVLSGRSMKAIARAADNTWQSNRAEKKSHHPQQSRIKKKGQPAPDQKRPDLTPFPKAKPSFVPPMKARLEETIPSQGQWLYEIKWDGYRALAVRNGERLELFTRNHRNIAGEFPELVAALQKIPQQQFVVDGEIVALNEQGRPSFQLMQNYREHLRRGTEATIVYYAFDLINLGGRSLVSAPLETRKDRLLQLVKEWADPLRFSGNLEGDPTALLEQAARQKLEGLIGKKKGSPYEPDRRSGAWIKLKVVNEQEFVIGGYTPPKGGRSHFGSVLVGYFEKGKLRFASRVGTGFDEALLRSLHRKFQAFRQESPPFIDVEKIRKSRYGLTAAEFSRCTWLKPKLVCQVRFTEWTSDGGLRHPVFLGLRDDKKPEEVGKV